MDHDHSIFLCEIDPYAGPIDLLLYLVREKRLEIAQIRLVDIADQYRDFVENMRDHYDLDQLSGYLLVSATLVQIKSRLMLPKPPEEEQIEEAVDLKEQMIVRLMRLQQFQDAAQELGQRPQLGISTFARPRTREKSTITVFRKPSTFELVAAFQDLQERVRLRKPMRVPQKGQSIRRQIHRMVLRLAEMFGRGQAVRLSELDGEAKDPTERFGTRVLNFLAMLHMIRLGQVSAEQQQVCGEVVLTAGSEWAGNEAVLMDALVADGTAEDEVE